MYQESHQKDHTNVWVLLFKQCFGKKARKSIRHFYKKGRIADRVGGPCDRASSRNNLRRGSLNSLGDFNFNNDGCE